MPITTIPARPGRAHWANLALLTGTTVAHAQAWAAQHGYSEEEAAYHIGIAIYDGLPLLGGR